MKSNTGLKQVEKASKRNLTHLFPMDPFSTNSKHQKTLRFPDVFRGWRKGALGMIELIIFYV